MVFLRVLEEVHHFHQLHLGFVHPGDVLEVYRHDGSFEQSGLGLAVVEGLATGRGHGAGDEQEDEGQWDQKDEDGPPAAATTELAMDFGAGVLQLPDQSAVLYPGDALGDVADAFRALLPSHLSFLQDYLRDDGSIHGRDELAIGNRLCGGNGSETGEDEIEEKGCDAADDGYGDKGGSIAAGHGSVLPRHRERLPALRCPVPPKLAYPPPPRA